MEPLLPLTEHSFVQMETTSKCVLQMVRGPELETYPLESLMELHRTQDSIDLKEWPSIRMHST